MREQAKTLEELVKELPPEGQKDVREFVERLLAGQKPMPRGKLRFDWAGAVRDLRDRYTSVELQHRLAREGPRSSD